MVVVPFNENLPGCIASDSVGNVHCQYPSPIAPLIPGIPVCQGVFGNYCSIDGVPITSQTSITNRPITTTSPIFLGRSDQGGVAPVGSVGAGLQNTTSIGAALTTMLNKPASGTQPASGSRIVSPTPNSQDQNVTSNASFTSPSSVMNLANGIGIGNILMQDSIGLGLSNWVYGVILVGVYFLLKGKR
jgi:hypothetical protein